MPLLLLAALAGGPLLVVIVVAAARVATRGGQNARREWRWVRVTWAASLAIGAVVAWVVAGAFTLGRGTMLAAAVLGLFVVGGVALAETVVRPPRPTGPRAASLAPRRVAEYLPRRLTMAVAGVTVLHGLTLTLTTATAASDDLGRAGRQVAARCGSFSSAAGPYPGSFYSAPLALLLLLVGVATAAALAAVARRPRGFAPDDAGDDALRRVSATRVLAAAGAAVAASHVGVAAFAAAALLRLDCQERGCGRRDGACWRPLPRACRCSAGSWDASSSPMCFPRPDGRW